jgi:hypothetical protein
MNLRKMARRGLPEYVRFLRLHARPSLPLSAVRRTAPPPHAGGASPRIVVTLTTIPSRIRRIVPTLRSLLDQTDPPECILLALPPFSRREHAAYAVPEALRAHPRVTLLPSERDWGPATKLLPALRAFAEDPDAALVAVDDDNVYPRTFLETFRRHAAAFPDAALGLRGFAVPPSRRRADCREFAGEDVESPTRTDVLQGCGGVLVRPRFFDAALFDHDAAPPEAWFVDDVWVSGHLARRGVPRYVLPYPGAHIFLPSLTTFSGPALDRDENRSGRNDDMMLEHFGAHWG